jgi:cystathionine beta-lyase/cystathionine gamma-synthase
LNKDINVETKVIHSGNELNETDAVIPPLWISVNYKSESLDKLAEISVLNRPEKFYARYSNPLLKQLSFLLSDLEKTEDALILGSGMAAISTAILSNVKKGDHIIAQKNLYAGTIKLLRDILPGFGVDTTFVDQEDNEQFKSAINNNTKLIYIETPSNPLLKITDLSFIGELGRSRGIKTLIDNTFASPVNQNPADFNIDIILHSATKYLGGHSDLLAGVICGSIKDIENAWEFSHILGHSLSSFDASLLLRGIKTLALRIERQNFNALQIAGYLSEHHLVKSVYYPGLPAFPQYSLAMAQMKGFGSIISFELNSDYENTRKFVENLKLCTLSVSLGSVETLITHPASMWKPFYSLDQLNSAGISESLIRISIGLENYLDIIEDMNNTFKLIY